eukprot:gene4889-8483_t
MFFGGSSTKVSLKGSNDKDSSREDLLANLKRKREESKNLKEKNNAAKKIQHIFMKLKMKKQFKEKIRQEYDQFNSKMTTKSLNAHLDQLLYFFNIKKDYGRFLNFSKLLLVHLHKTEKNDEKFFEVSTIYQRLKYEKLINLLFKNLKICFEKNEKNRNQEYFLNLIFLLISEESFKNKTFYYDSLIKFTKEENIFKTLKQIILKDNLRICWTILQRLLIKDEKNMNFFFQFFTIEDLSNKIDDGIFNINFIVDLKDEEKDEFKNSFKKINRNEKLNLFVNLVSQMVSNVEVKSKLKHLKVLHFLFENFNETEEFYKKNEKKFHQILTKNNLIKYLISTVKISHTENEELSLDEQFEYISNFCQLISVFFEKFNEELKRILINQIVKEKNFLKILWNEIDSHSKFWDNEKIINSPFSEMINIFSIFFKHNLLFLDDNEFKKIKEPFKLDEIKIISKKLNNLLFKLYWNSNMKNIYLRENLTQLIKMINSRDSRIKFCPKDHWLVEEGEKINFSLVQGTILINQQENLFSNDNESNVVSMLERWDYFETPSFEESLKHRMIEKSKNRTIYLSEKEERIKLILKNIPFVISFETRLNLFQNFIQKLHNDHSMTFLPPVTVRRNFIFEDGFSSLFKLDLKNNINVQFKNDQGLMESGIGFGVFKEFVTEISKNAFGSNYGLFTFTEDNLIYPNPSAKFFVENYSNYFEFLGKILGKSMYEKILVDIPFARFFISKILCKNNLFNDLPYLDPDLHKNLTILKNYDQDVKDLSLDFTISDNYFGKLIEKDLIPNGSNIEVTNENKFLYIHKMTNFRLNLQIQEESNACLKGINSIIPFEWLQLFDENELFYIICGSEQSIDIFDFQNNIELDGYSKNDITIKYFFELVSEMTNEELKSLLKFITSSSRAPLLGFKDLNPKICIKKTTDYDLERLPTASTCINLLKLPDYKSKLILKKKLFQAIENGTTFELS